MDIAPFVDEWENMEKFRYHGTEPYIYLYSTAVDRPHLTNLMISLMYIRLMDTYRIYPVRPECSRIIRCSLFECGHQESEQIMTDRESFAIDQNIVRRIGISPAVGETSVGGIDSGVCDSTLYVTIRRSGWKEAYETN
jgi:hypothetical protein